MISINATLFIQVLHFLILIFILNRIMFRPIIRLMRERSRHIEGLQRETERIKSEALQLVHKRMSLEMGARKEAGAERARLKKEAEDLAAEILGDHRAKVAAIRADVIQRIDVQLDEARRVIKQEAAVLADEISETLLAWKRVPHDHG
jgi:F-type H+-transporting ATPase subunit b